MEDAVTNPTEDSTMLPVQLAMPLALMVGAAIAATTTPSRTDARQGAPAHDPVLHGPTHLLDACVAPPPSCAVRRCMVFHANEVAARR